MIGYKNSKVPRLFELMQERNIKAKDITEATGISAGSLTDWKSGRSMPTGNRLLAIAKFLNVSAEYLVGSEQTDSDPLEEQIKIAVSDLTDEQKQDVLKYIRFLKSK